MHSYSASCSKILHTHKNTNCCSFEDSSRPFGIQHRCPKAPQSTTTKTVWAHYKYTFRHAAVEEWYISLYHGVEVWMRLLCALCDRRGCVFRANFPSLSHEWIRAGSMRSTACKHAADQKLDALQYPDEHVDETGGRRQCRRITSTIRVYIYKATSGWIWQRTQGVV